MTSNPATIQRRPRRTWLTLLLATAGTLRSFAADAEPAASEQPAPPAAETPTAPAPAPEIAPPLEAPAPAAAVPAEPVEPAAPDTAAKRPVYRDQLVGIFQSVHLRANEAAEQVVAVFGDVVIEGRVGDQVVSVFGNTDVRAKVDGDVVTVFGNSTITQDVAGDVVCVFGDLQVGPDVHVGGELVSVGGYTTLDRSTSISGEQVSVPIPGLRHFGSWVRECLLHGRLYVYNRPSTWLFIGAMFVLSLMVAAIFRGPVDSSIGVLERRPSAAFLNGMLSALLVPAGLFLVTVTGVGVIVVPFLWVGVMFATLIGAIAIARFTGFRLGLGMNPVIALAGGHLVLAVLYMLPYIGLLFWAGVMMFGFGTAITALLESRRREARANGGAAPTPPPVPTPPVTPAAETPAAAAAFTAESTMPPPTPVAPVAVLPAAVTAGAAATAGPSVPPPTPPVPGAIERADFWPRVAAVVLDLLFVVLAHAFVLPFMPVPFLWLAYHIAFWAWRGTTPGGIVMNLRIDRLDGRPVDASVAIVRGLGAILSVAALGLGFLWMNWDPERQTWHDKIAGTVVVRTPRGQSLV